MKVKVTIPKKGKLKVSFGKTPSHRRNATLIFKLIERRFLRSGLREKTSIEVRYPSGGFNESLVSLDARYLLFTLACFLEDHLEPQFLDDKYKEYK